MVRGRDHGAARLHLCYTHSMCRVPQSSFNGDTLGNSLYAVLSVNLPKTEKSEMIVTEYYPPLRHSQSVIESNCRRLLKGTANACIQAGIVLFKSCVCIFNMKSLFYFNIRSLLLIHIIQIFNTYVCFYSDHRCHVSM